MSDLIKWKEEVTIQYCATESKVADIVVGVMDLSHLFFGTSFYLSTSNPTGSQKLMCLV
jgi:hypothetical protein